LWPYLEISSAVSDRDEGQTRKTWVKTAYDRAGVQTEQFKHASVEWTAVPSCPTIAGDNTERYSKNRMDMGDRHKLQHIASPQLGYPKTLPSINSNVRFKPVNTFMRKVHVLFLFSRSSAHIEQVL
jgi:hypothetical protein